MKPQNVGDAPGMNLFTEKVTAFGSAAVSLPRYKRVGILRFDRFQPLWA